MLRIAYKHREFGTDLSPIFWMKKTLLIAKQSQYDHLSAVTVHPLK
jgi:hypothetical protein